MSGRNPKERRSEDEVWINLDESVLIFWKILNFIFIVRWKSLNLHLMWSLSSTFRKKYGLVETEFLGNVLCPSSRYKNMKYIR